MAKKKRQLFPDGPAKRLKSLRTKLDMTQRDLAQEFYVTPGAVAQWETRFNPIPGPVLKLIEIYEERLTKKA